MLRFTDNADDIVAEIESGTFAGSPDDLMRRIERAALAAGDELVEYARSTTGTLIKPATRNAAGNYIPVAERTSRFGHPGGWGDITSTTSNSYGYDVEAANDTVALVLYNTAETARYLEARGYWVLSGLFEGMAQQTINRHIADVLA